MELDPRYCDAIVKRYIALVGDEEVKIIRKGKAIPYIDIDN